MDIKKSEAYKNLVLEMQLRYPIYQKKALADNKVKLYSPHFNDEMICHEINVYTYCQGLDYAVKTPKIKYLLVAQDFGSLLKHGISYIEKIKRINAGDKSIPYIDDEFLKSSNTTKNLIPLFNILGYDITKRYDELFFTNFCLGYRGGNNGNGGGMTKKLMMSSADLFKRLCEILEPESILCLGRVTFECVYKALTGTKYSIKTNYRDFLENHSEISVSYGNVQSFIYPLAHCGKMGTIDRNHGLPKQSDPLYYQKQDWARIARENKNS